MGHRGSDRRRAKTALALFTFALLLALPQVALAGGPFHTRSKSLDITGLNHACGAAVDSKGDVYLSSAGTSEVKVYNPAHTFLTSIEDTHEPCGLAVTTTGNLYVSEKGTGNVVKYHPSEYPPTGSTTYSATTVDASTKAKGIAVDRFDNFLYVAEGTRVSAYDAEGNLYLVNEKQRVAVDATGGTFKLEFKGQPTEPIPYNASAPVLQAELEALSTIGSGNVTVSSGEVFVTFTGARAHEDVPALIADGSGLTGSGSQAVTVKEEAQGFSGHLGEGTLTEATGVAAYSYPYDAGAQSGTERYLWVADAKSEEADRLYLFRGKEANGLKLRNGNGLTGANTPDGSFGFGSAGAYLAEDPGNRDSKGNCVVVGEQACTAGHLYLYDATHKALDEFDASGAYLDQVKNNPAFGDAEPSAIAIDRSGVAPNDGTLYVTAGKEADAKALAFGPLKPPARKALKTPSEETGGLSQKLAGAKGVATDSHGDVYAVAGAFIHVYDPKGAELLTGGKALIEDKHTPENVAVDSTGKVYVWDRNGNLVEDDEVTYYTPSAYPPIPGTTYTRRAEPIVIAKEFPPPNESLTAIAVDPGPGAGKDRLFVASRGVDHIIHVYDSAANGSGPLDAEFAQGLLGGVIASIAVNGADGTVYVGTNPHLINAVNATGKEVLARFENTGASNGKAGANSSPAVDQATGHVLEYDGSTKTVHEYDAAGAFVAEFGNFTEGLSREYQIAVDNACAIHVNGEGKPEPLDETTTPTCHEYDPANGTAYLAWADTKKTPPPYNGVNAFGVLEYAQKGEPPTVATGVADEFAPGAATLHGTVDPNEAALEKCEFEYLTDAAYRANVKALPGDEEAAFAGAEAKKCAESFAEIGEGNDPVPVHAKVSGLDPEVPYRFRLVAANSGGPRAGKAVLFGPPVIAAKSALPILYHEATLRAEVGSSGLATEYRFEYLDRQSFEEQGGFEGPATHHTDLGELAPAEASVPVSASLFGLAEGTEYLFRAVAKNADARVVGPTGAFVTQARRAAEECPNAIYRFGLSANLPDCRAYELVTPAQTDGLTPRAEGDGGTPSGTFSNWLTPQRGAGAGERLSYFTGGTLPGFEGNGILDGYRAERGAGDHPAGGWQSALFSPGYTESAPGVNHFATQHGVASDQLYSIWQIDSEPETFPETLLEGVYLRTPSGFEAIGQGSLGTDLAALSRYIGPGGKHVIFISGAQLEPGAAGGGIYDRAAGKASAELISVKPDGSTFGGGATYLGATEDGSAVVFSVGGTLYLHRAGQTTEIATAPNTFAGISEDGRRVFYAATENGASDGGLYVCDTEAGACAGAGAHSPQKIATAGIFALVSPDGSRAFFSSTEALSGSEENDNGEEAEAGKRNLYAWDGAKTRFIGRLAAQDFENKGFAGTAGMNLAAWTGALKTGSGVGRSYAPTRSSAHGGAIVFQSHARLTAYDNEGVGEIYRYEPAAATGSRLLCVSCDPSGNPSSADALLEDIRNGAGSPLRNSTTIASLTEDGKSVFFQSFDRLLPEDANEAEDVYEWRAKGSGTTECTRPGGCLALISSGQGEVPSFLYAMSGDGRNVFFQTKEKLVGMDVPGSPSIYDAREGGGIPEPIEPAPCQGDACQGQGTLPPGLPGPASTGGGEAGGEASSPPISSCAKGKHRVKGRCVATKHKKRHAKKHRRAGANRGGKR